MEREGEQRSGRRERGGGEQRAEDNQRAGGKKMMKGEQRADTYGLRIMGGFPAKLCPPTSSFRVVMPPCLCFIHIVPG